MGSSRRLLARVQNPVSITTRARRWRDSTMREERGNDEDGGDFAHSSAPSGDVWESRTDLFTSYCKPGAVSLQSHQCSERAGLSRSHSEKKSGDGFDGGEPPSESQNFGREATLTADSYNNCPLHLSR